MGTTPRKRSKILTLLQYSVKSQREIAKLCSVNQSTVSRVKKHYIATGTLSSLRQGKCGRKRKTSERDDRYLMLESIKNPKKISEQLMNDLATHDIHVCSSTVRRKLIAVRRFAKKPSEKPLLTDVMKKKRLLWAKEYKKWTKEQWRRVRQNVFIKFTASLYIIFVYHTIFKLKRLNNS